MIDAARIDQLYKLAKDRGGWCLSDTYKGSLAKLLWQCAKGHRWEATPARVKRGSWCPTCKATRRSQCQPSRHTPRMPLYSIVDMQKVAAERGGRCLSETYKNNATKLLWECSEGHRWEATPNKVKSGRWCPQCYNKTRGDFRKLSIEEMVQIASDRGGRCLSEVYTNTRTKLKWECREGHHWEAVPSSVKKGTWCPECFKVGNSSRSKREQIAP